MPEQPLRQSPNAIPATSARQASILSVDDDPNVLAALSRVFRAQGYRVLTAPSGHAGLQILESEPVELVISDMRMPEMDGAKFLEQVRARWPDTIRLLLTGYADIPSILDAINHGEIYRYLVKPWDDTDMVLIVRHALERQALEREKRRLEALTARQNDELMTLNATLEKKVRERTAALQLANSALTESNEKLNVANGSLAQANEKLEKNFVTSIKVFTNLIDMRGGQFAGRSRRVADLAWEIALKMGLGEQGAYEVLVAGLLHDIGKIGLSDELLAKPLHRMDDEELARYHKHPAIGQNALMPLQDLRGAARMVRGQHERYAGGGFPDGLTGADIPLGARILAVTVDYIRLQAGGLFAHQLSPKDAAINIQHGSGTMYDPRVVDAFVAVVNAPRDDDLQDMSVSVSELRPGMVLSRDLVGPDGMLLLTAKHVLDQNAIEQIKGLDRVEARRMTVHVISRKNNPPK